MKNLFWYEASRRREIGEEFVGVLPTYDNEEHVWRVTKHEVIDHTHYVALRHYCEMIDFKYAEEVWN